MKLISKQQPAKGSIIKTVFAFIPFVKGKGMAVSWAVALTFSLIQSKF